MTRRQKGCGPFKGRTRQTGRSQRGGSLYKRYRSRRRNHMFPRAHSTDIIYYR